MKYFITVNLSTFILPTLHDHPPHISSVCIQAEWNKKKSKKTKQNKNKKQTNKKQVSLNEVIIYAWLPRSFWQRTYTIVLLVDQLRFSIVVCKVKKQNKKKQKQKNLRPLA